MTNTQQSDAELQDTSQEEKDAEEKKAATEGKYARDKLRTDLIKLAGANSVSQRVKSAQ